jgi:hypothetical protein
LISLYLFSHIPSSLSSDGTDLDQCVENIQQNSLETIASYQNLSWAVKFDAYRSQTTTRHLSLTCCLTPVLSAVSHRRTFSMEEKKEFLQKLSVLPLRGQVKLTNPDLSIWAVFHYVRHNYDNHTEGDTVENHSLERVYLGRLLGQGGMREAGPCLTCSLDFCSCSLCTLSLPLSLVGTEEVRSQKTILHRSHFARPHPLSYHGEYRSSPNWPPCS